MPHHYHFRSSIDPDQIDERVDALDFESRSEYIRYLIREDMQKGVVSDA
jgi:Arc/MetJ-type ribon-helix-helix transcriptional regulator